MSGTRLYHAPLPPRAREVAGFIPTGLTNKEIACKMVISLKAVENYIREVYQYYGYAAIGRGYRVKLALAIVTEHNELRSTT